jgi:hypothetical protein
MRTAVAPRSDAHTAGSVITVAVLLVRVASLGPSNVPSPWIDLMQRAALVTFSPGCHVRARVVPEEECSSIFFEQLDLVRKASDRVAGA